jgi:hypothetical protein
MFLRMRSAFFEKSAIRWIWVVAALPLLVFPAGYIVGGSGAGSAAIRAALADPLSIFSARSPGARGAGALSQSKLAYSDNGSRGGGIGGGSGGDAGAGAPGDGSFSDTGLFPSGSPEGVESGLETIGSFGDTLYPPSEQFGGAGYAGYFGGDAGYDSFGVFGIGGALTGGGIGSLPGEGVVIVPASGTAVPEPQSWLMLLTGFALIGSALRSRTRKNARAIAGSTRTILTATSD